MILKNPGLGMEHRALLHAVDFAAGTVRIDGVVHPLLDARLPTVDPANPYALVPEERACIDRLKKSFLESAILWRHVAFMVRPRQDGPCPATTHSSSTVASRSMPRGASWRCPSPIATFSGHALFDALEAGGLPRAGDARQQEDVDRLWYLWTGPLSPLFGKDKMTTFEGHFVADKAAQKETKNPYFALLHDAAFCERILAAEFGVDPAREASS